MMRRYWGLRQSLLILIVLGLLLPVGVLAAHPADMYLQEHMIRFTSDGAYITWSISPGALLAFLTWEEADVDGDSVVSQQEAYDWVAPNMPEYVIVVEESIALPWQVEAVDWPTSIARFEMSDERVVISMFAPWPEGFSGEQSIIIYNRFQEDISVNWFTLEGEDGMTFMRPTQQNGLLQLQVNFLDAPSIEGALDLWDSGTPAISASGDMTEPAPELPARTAANWLTDLVSEEEMSAGFLLLAIGIALVLGAIHALTPGHGKTLVAAYLVGSRGTTRHALALGTIVTLTHTGSVLTLGLITLAFSRYVLPTDIFPILEIVSGLIIVVMGLVLLGQRYRGWRSVQKLRQRKAAEAAAPPQPEKSQGTSRTIAINQPVAQAKEFNAVLPAGEFGVGDISWRSLLTLGISGGLVPCPDAIAILLVAIAINRIVLGLTLVVSFSLGLAVVLIAIGLAMVQSRRLAERFGSFERIVPALPLVSAIIVLLLGFTLTYSALQRAGIFDGEVAQSPAVALIENAAVAFSLNDADVVFLAPDADGYDQLMRVSAAGGESEALTTDNGVWDFAISPDGSQIAYARAHESGSGSALHLIDVATGENARVLDCTNGSCRNVVWAPDGTKIVYEGLDFTEASSSIGDITSLYWLDVATGENGPIFQDRTLPSTGARWSPSGEWLSYISGGATGLQIYNLNDGTNTTLPTLTGAAAIWAPDGQRLLMTDVQPAGQRFLTHLLLVDMRDGSVTDLTGEAANIEDTAAAWAPDGETIAIVRRTISDADRSPGNQIWLLDPASADLEQLTDEPGIIHQVPVWSPDGRYLLYARYQMNEEWPQPHTMALDVTTGEITEITWPGNFPQWLP